MPAYDFNRFPSPHRRGPLDHAVEEVDRTEGADCSSLMAAVEPRRGAAGDAPAPIPDGVRHGRAGRTGNQSRCVGHRGSFLASQRQAGTIIFAAAMLLAIPASAQDAGEPYHGLLSPSGAPCCGTADCAAYPEGAVRYGESGLELSHENEWLPVPDDAILDRGSWDGMFHACVIETYGWRGGQPTPRREVRCAILPGVA